MTLDTYIDRITTDLTVSDIDIAELLQRSYDYTCDKLRLNVFALYAKIDGGCSIQDCRVSGTGSYVFIKELSTIYNATLNESYEMFPTTGSIILYEHQSDINEFITDGDVTFKNNCLYTDTPVYCTLLAHVRPYVIVGVNPFDSEITYDVADIITDYSDRHINTLLAPLLACKFKSLYFQSAGDISTGGNFDYIWTMLLNIYNQSFDQIYNANLTQAGKFYDTVNYPSFTPKAYQL